jgi:hypothetical protein
MAVLYRGPKPSKNYSLKDFYKNGIVISWWAKFKNNNKTCLRVIFRSNGLLGEIRTTADSKSYAIDVRWGWWSSQESCLTTECKSLKEAKSILFEWFKSKGYTLPKEETDNDWTKKHLAFDVEEFKRKQKTKEQILLEAIDYFNKNGKLQFF